ncbi:MAG TPA: RNA methyltransferase [Flavobacterium sp.]|nr:RNA methyltransferase [Flavobacterium sp.]
MKDLFLNKSKFDNTDNSLYFCPMNDNFITEFFGIGIQNGKTPENLGVLWRSAQNLGASFIFTIGNRYAKQACDTENAVKSMPYFHYEDFDDFYKNLPKGARLVGVELDERAEDLEAFEHPRRCVYLLGAEDNGLSKKAIAKCHHLVKFKSKKSLNVSVAGSIVLYDRGLNKPRS